MPLVQRVTSNYNDSPNFTDSPDLFFAKEVHRKKEEKSLCLCVFKFSRISLEPRDEILKA